jgi:hypothetical protein
MEASLQQWGLGRLQTRRPGPHKLRDIRPFPETEDASFRRNHCELFGPDGSDHLGPAICPHMSSKENRGRVARTRNRKGKILRPDGLPERSPAEMSWCEHCQRHVVAISPRRAASLGTSLLKSGHSITSGNFHLIGLADGSILVCGQSFLLSGAGKPKPK